MAKKTKTALVTGGAKRIGKGICVRLAEMGYSVALHYFNSRDEAEETAGLIEKQGVVCELFRADFSKPKNARAVVEKACGKFGEISVLVNNASVFEKTGFMRVTEKSLENDMAVNFKSPFFATQAFAEKNSGGGLAVNILDGRVEKNHTAHFAYSLSKKCLWHFTLSAAKTLAPKIRVNAICPGPILRASGGSTADFKKIARAVPLKKSGEIKHISLALEYLILNPFVTGETLFVDGGQRL